MRKIINTFTLFETIVGIVILSLAMIALSRVAISSNFAWSKQSIQATLIQEGRWALELMSNELRCATVSSINTDFVPNYWDGMRIEFQGDIDNDGSLERIRYERRREWGVGFINKLVRRGRTGWGWGPRIDLSAFVVDNPGNADIFSHDGSGLITVKITLRPRPLSPEGAGNRNVTFRTKIRARNP